MKYLTISIADSEIAIQNRKKAIKRTNHNKKRRGSERSKRSNKSNRSEISKISNSSQ
jgi:hypothetical protein